MSAPSEMLEMIKNSDPDLASAIESEIDRQKNSILLIASENYPSKPVLQATGSVLANKYAEGYPSRRYYGGCEFVDIAERLAQERAMRLFGAEHANVQPHSGTQANMAAYAAVVQPGDTILGMRLDQGGHLSHGSPVNFSGQTYNFIGYGVDRETELVDFDEVERLAIEHRPAALVAGYTAYPREVDFSRFRSIADSIGALLIVDMAHISGLIAGGAHASPLPHAQIVTSTTHKTLRGPRGALILATEEHAKAVDKAVFPRTQGGPFMHVIAAKAVAFGEALRPGFALYAEKIVENSRALAKVLSNGGMRLVSGGTDTHLILVDLTPLGITGRKAEEALGEMKIYVNRNAIPYDPRPPRVTSGLRIGTAALTSRGMGTNEMVEVGNLILQTLEGIDDVKATKRITEGVASLTGRFPVPGINEVLGYPFFSI